MATHERTEIRSVSGFYVPQPPKPAPDPSTVLVSEILQSVGIMPDGLAERIVRELRAAGAMSA